VVFEKVRQPLSTKNLVLLTPVMKKYYEFGVELHLIFIDCKQEYDSINRNVLERIRNTEST